MLWNIRNAVFWKSLTHSVNEVMWFWKIFSRTSSETLHCGNVVNMPYWILKLIHTSSGTMISIHMAISQCNMRFLCESLCTHWCLQMDWIMLSKFTHNWGIVTINIVLQYYTLRCIYLRTHITHTWTCSWETFSQNLTPQIEYEKVKV